MHKCEYCNKRVWFWHVKIFGMHILCYLAKRYSLLQEYLNLRDTKLHLDFNLCAMKEPVTVKKYKEMEQRIKDLEKILSHA